MWYNLVPDYYMIHVHSFTIVISFEKSNIHLRGDVIFIEPMYQNKTNIPKPLTLMNV